MRIRTIKPDFFTHEGLYDLEAETGLPVRVAFIGLWCAADREGRFKWQVRRLKVQILPYDEIDFSRVLDALATRGFLVKYTYKGSDFGVIPTFKEHQVINNREKDSELPEPPEIKGSDACLTREPRVDHADTVEGKGRERKGRDIPPAPKTDFRSPTIDQAIEAGRSIMLPADAVTHWWNTREASGWMKSSAGGGAMPVKNWRADLAASKSWAKDGAKQSCNGSEKRQLSSSDVGI